MEHKELGQKTYIFLLLKRSGFFFFLLLAFALFLIFTDFVAGFAKSYLQIIDFLFVVAIMLTAGATLGIVRLEYKNYTVSIYDKNLKITRGILNRQEIGIPYKNVKRADVVRTLACQIFGVSNLRIMTGDEDGIKDVTVEVPYIEKNLATTIQKEILEHAEVDQFRDTNLHAMGAMPAGTDPKNTATT